MNTLNYRPEIDGLRAWAVLPVIFFHAGFEVFKGGFIGVDVFFVISGYLVTSLLIKDLERGSFSIAHFYERRARRILPALYFVLAIVLVAGWFHLFPTDYADLSASLVATIVFLSNVYFFKTTNYFSASADTTPLLNMWTLSVEEQYYIGFPILLWVTFRFGWKAVWLTLLAVFAVSLVTSQYLSTVYAPFSYYMILTRAWELMIGSLLAVWMWTRPPLADKRIREIGGWAGFSMIVASVFMLDKSYLYPSLFTLLPTVGTALVIYCASSTTSVGRMLSLRPLVLVGLISYSAYLWHQPLFAFVRYYAFPQPSLATMLGLTISSLVIAYLSWRFVEAPFREKGRFNRNQIFFLSGAVGAALAGAGLVGYFADGFKNRGIVQGRTIAAFNPDNRALRKASWARLRDITRDPNYGVTGNAVDRDLWFSNATDRVKVLIVGNSHAKDLYNALSFSRDVAANAELARLGTQIRDLSPQTFDLPNYRAADIVFIASKFEGRDLEDFDWFVERVLADGKTLVLTPSPHPFPFKGGAQLADHLVRNNLKNVDDLERTREKVNLAYYRDLKASESAGTSSRYAERIARLAAKYPRVIVADRLAYVCENQTSKCDILGEDLEKHFYDYGHYTLAGSKSFGNQIDQIGWFMDILAQRSSTRRARP